MSEAVLAIGLGFIFIGMYFLVIFLVGKFLKVNLTDPDSYANEFKPGDGALCLTTNDRFTVAAVTHDMLYAAGWPCTGFPREDCIKTHECTKAQSESMMQDCLGLPAGDPRRSLAEIFQGQADGGSGCRN